MIASERRFKILEKEKKHQTFHSLHLPLQPFSFHATGHEESVACGMSALWGISFIIFPVFPATGHSIWILVSTFPSSIHLEILYLVHSLVITTQWTPVTPPTWIYPLPFSMLFEISL